MQVKDANLKEYYAKRAKEYESIYNRKIPIRLREQKSLALDIQKSFKNKYVLEVACGTGYWTKYLSKAAKKILSTDLNQEMLDIASSRLKGDSIQFQIADAYDLPVSAPKFNGAMANCWFSHVPKGK